MPVIEAKVSTASAIMSGAFVATGFVAPWPEVVAGYFFAVAGGFAGMSAVPPTERLGVTLTLFLALVIGTFAGIAHPHVGVLSAFPIQLVMGLSGLASRPVARRLASGDFSLPWKKEPKP